MLPGCGKALQEIWLARHRLQICKIHTQQSQSTAKKPDQACRLQWLSLHAIRQSWDQRVNSWQTLLYPHRSQIATTHTEAWLSWNQGNRVRLVTRLETSDREKETINHQPYCDQFGLGLQALSCPSYVTSGCDRHVNFGSTTITHSYSFQICQLPLLSVL